LDFSQKMLVIGLVVLVLVPLLNASCNVCIEPNLPLGQVLNATVFLSHGNVTVTVPGEFFVRVRMRHTNMGDVMMLFGNAASEDGNVLILFDERCEDYADYYGEFTDNATESNVYPGEGCNVAHEHPNYETLLRTRPEDGQSFAGYMPDGAQAVTYMIAFDDNGNFTNEGTIDEVCVGWYGQCSIEGDTLAPSASPTGMPSEMPSSATTFAPSLMTTASSTQMSSASTTDSASATTTEGVLDSTTTTAAVTTRGEFENDSDDDDDDDDDLTRNEVAGLVVAFVGLFLGILVCIAYWWTEDKCVC
jgi:hypothetical protein